MTDGRSPSAAKLVEAWACSARADAPGDAPAAESAAGEASLVAADTFRTTVSLRWHTRGGGLSPGGLSGIRDGCKVEGLDPCC